MMHRLLARLDLSAQSFRVVSTYYISYIALGTVTPSLGTALPFLAERTGVSLDIASSMFSARALGFMLGSFVIGRVLERLPAHGVIQAALLLMAFTVLGLAVAPAFILMLLLLVATGFFTAWMDVGTNILIVWQLRAKVTPFLTGMHFIWGIGALLTPLIIVHLQLRTGALLAPFALIALFVAACVLLYVRMPSPAPVATADDNRYPLPRVPLITLMVMLFLAGTLELAMGGFIFSYLLTTELSTKQIAGGVTSSFFAAITCTRLLAVFLLMRYSSHRVLMAALTLITGAVMAVLWLPVSLTVIWVAVLFCGIGEAVLFPLTLALTPHYVPAVGRATSLMFVGVSLGSLTMPLLIGHLFETVTVGPQVIWYYTLVGALLYTGCLLVLHFHARSAGSAVPVTQAVAVTE